MVSGDICVIGESAQLFLQPVIAPSCGRPTTRQKLAGLERCKCCELKTWGLHALEPPSDLKFEMSHHLILIGSIGEVTYEVMII